MSLWDTLPEDLQIMILDEKEKKNIFSCKYDCFHHIQKKIFHKKYKELLYYMLNDENEEKKNYYNYYNVGDNIKKHNNLKNNRYYLDDDLIYPFERDIFLSKKKHIETIINKYPPIIIKELYPAYYNIDFKELQSIQLIRRYLHKITYYE